MAVSVTANATSTPPGGTGSAAQAGAMGSSGGTTTGTVACSSCCAPQGRYLTPLFGGYGEVGSCPGAIDNSQIFDMYFTAVLSFNSPYTAAQFCLPSSVTITARAIGLRLAPFVTSACSTISPPATQNTVSASGNNPIFVSADSANNSYLNYFAVEMCSCNSSNRVGLTFQAIYTLLTVVSCSPPVYSFSANIISFTNVLLGTASITVTF